MTPAPRRRGAALTLQVSLSLVSALICVALAEVMLRLVSPQPPSWLAI